MEYITTAQTDPSVARAPAEAVTWATVTTLKERPEVVRNFVAHHLYLGASEIILFFDDPTDPSYEMVKTVPKVRAYMCDDTHWRRVSKGVRPDRHQKRQRVNARKGYKICRSDWIIHLDADEYLSCDGALMQTLAETSENALRVRPFEVLKYPRSGVDGRRTHVFRGVLPKSSKGQRAAAKAYGQFSSALFSGMLSHAAGKYLVRTGVEGMNLSIHAPFEGAGRRQAYQDAPGSRLLHFHGGDYAHWLERVEYRLQSGAYMQRYQADRSSPQDVLNLVLKELQEQEGEAGLARFYRAVCTYGKEKAVLQRHDALHYENMWFEDKVAAVFDMPARLRKPSHGVAGFEADVEWNGLSLRVTPDDNYIECLVARGQFSDQQALDYLTDLVRDRRVRFYDVGANVGLYTLSVARHSAPDSAIIAYEPHPELQRRFEQNLGRNGYANITLRREALAATAGRGWLKAVAGQDLRHVEVSTSDNDGVEVPLTELAQELQPYDDFDLCVLRIDAGAADRDIIQAALHSDNDIHWPDVIMLVNQPENDGFDSISALLDLGFTPELVTQKNTFLYRERE